MDLTAVAEFVAYPQVVDQVGNSAACCSFPKHGYSFDYLSDGMESSEVRLYNNDLLETRNVVFITYYSLEVER